MTDDYKKTERSWLYKKFHETHNHSTNMAFCWRYGGDSLRGHAQVQFCIFFSPIVLHTALHHGLPNLICIWQCHALLSLRAKKKTFPLFFQLRILFYIGAKQKHLWSSTFNANAARLV